MTVWPVPGRFSERPTPWGIGACWAQHARLLRDVAAAAQSAAPVRSPATTVRRRAARGNTTKRGQPRPALADHVRVPRRRGVRRRDAPRRSQSARKLPPPGAREARTCRRSTSTRRRRTGRRPGGLAGERPPMSRPALAWLFRDFLQLSIRDLAIGWRHRVDQRLADRRLRNVRGPTSESRGAPRRRSERS